MHPDVLECAVLGIDDGKWGQAVNATVVLKPGAPADAAGLIAFAKKSIGSICAPKAVYFLARLPRTAVDKVSKADVRKLIEAGGRLPPA